MKKLVMAMAIALATVAAQAEDVVINIGGVFRAGTYDNIRANGYLIYSDTLSQSDAVAAFYSAGASSYESTIASSAALATEGYIDDGLWCGNAAVSRISDMYVLCFDQDNNYMYVSPVNTPEGSFLMWEFNIDAEDTSTAAAMSASSGYQGAGWYTGGTSPVPEPTSGLLMLLGVAGLALKRKRA